MRINDNTHHILLNWSRWCWSGPWPGPLPSDHCGSAEHHYRSPPSWNPDDEPEDPRINPNEREARIVQRVYDKLLNASQRLVLKAEYPARHESGRTESKAVAAARLGIPEWAYDRHLEAAVGQVEKEFADPWAR